MTAPDPADASVAESRRLPRWARWLLLLLLAASLAAGIGLREPAPPDEPRFVLAAKTMVESGEWLLPRRGAEIYAEKPPPFMWAQAASWLLVRDWRVAFLLPSLLAALATLWLVRDIGRRLWTPEVGWHAAAALFVCLQFGLQAKRAQIDMVLVALTTLALWGLLRALLQPPARGSAALGGFAAGLGTVTKGVGFLPLLILLPWAWLRRGGRLPAARLPVWLLPLAFAAGAAVWLGPLLGTVLVSEDPALAEYTRHLLFRQTAVRYADSWHHLKPAWYYLEVVVTMWLPLALLLPWLLRGWWRALRARDPATSLLLVWVLLVFIFFSASPGKRSVYLFPALPALCLAAAPLLPELLRRRGVQRLLALWVLLMSLLLGGLGLAGLAGAIPNLSVMAVERALAPAMLHSLLCWLVAIGGGGLLAAGIALWRPRRSAAAVVAFAALLWAGMGLGISPALDASSSARGLMTRVGERIGPQAELGLIAWREQQLLQVDRPAGEFGFGRSWQAQWQAAQAWVAEAPQRRWLFVFDEALSPCVDAEQAIAIGRANRRDWLLLPGTALIAGCRTPPLADETANAGEPADAGGETDDGDEA